MIEPKVPIIGASIGFGLSLLVGIINRISVSTLLFRAFVMGLLFGILSLVAKYLVDRYIPEIFDSDKSNSESGNKVDISIGEQESSPDKVYETATNVDTDMVPDFLQEAKESTASEEAARYGQIPRADEPVNVPKNVVGTESATEVENRETGHVEQTKTADGLDVLPDLEDFVPDVSSGAAPESDSSVSEATTGAGTDDNGAKSWSSGYGSKDMDVETETMAKAIHTILARETE